MLAGYTGRGAWLSWFVMLSHLAKKAVVHTPATRYSPDRESDDVAQL